jgi:conjugal transfer pilus assembly protein TraF
VAKTEGFLFFYKGNDPYSVAFGELLLQFVNSYHISIIPISVDGVKLKEFPDSRLDNGQANYMHISQFPALFLVSTTTHQIKPLAFGFMTVDSLRDRILKVMTNVGVH